MRIRIILFVVLTGILAVVLIAFLLLFGVPPRVVFMPGFFVKSQLASIGFDVPNAVGVLTTVLVFWASVVGAHLSVARLVRHRAA